MMTLKLPNPNHLVPDDQLKLSTIAEEPGVVGKFSLCVMPSTLLFIRPTVTFTRQNRKEQGLQWNLIRLFVFSLCTVLSFFNLFVIVDPISYFSWQLVLGVTAGINKHLAWLKLE